jgi:hypothetical protein
MKLDWEYVVGGIVTLALSLMKYFSKDKKDIMELRQIETLENKIAIKEELNHLKRDTGSPRVLLLYTKNGGDYPDVGTRLKINILEESLDNEVISHLDLIEDLLTDHQYNVLLRKLHAENMVYVRRKGMEEGILKQFFREFYIESAYIIKVGAVGKRFYYISVSWYEEKEITDKIELYSRLRASKIYKRLL